jgi:hypothetical protein
LVAAAWLVGALTLAVIAGAAVTAALVVRAAVTAAGVAVAAIGVVGASLDFAEVLGNPSARVVRSAVPGATSTGLWRRPDSSWPWTGAGVFVAKVGRYSDVGADSLRPVEMAWLGPASPVRPSGSAGVVAVAIVFGRADDSATATPVATAGATALVPGLAASEAGRELAGEKALGATVRATVCAEDSGANGLAVGRDAAIDFATDSATDSATVGSVPAVVVEWITAEGAAEVFAGETVPAAGATPSPDLASDGCAVACEVGSPGCVSAGAAVGFVAGALAPSACAALPSNWAKAACRVTDLPGLPSPFALAWGCPACA